MVEPVAFGFNEETAANNYFQQRTVAAGETVQACALKEFRGMVDKLRANGIEVIAVQDTQIPHTPDSIFPNNWVSFHDDGTVVLYPMFAENRRAERRADILQRIESEGFSIRRKVDYTGFEEENRFLEGTGGIILDRVNRYAYAALSQRVDKALLGRFCKEQNFYSGVLSCLSDCKRTTSAHLSYQCHDVCGDRLCGRLSGQHRRRGRA